MVSRVARDPSELHGRAGFDARRIPLDAPEAAPQLHHDAANAAVAHEHVRPAAEDRERGAGGGRRAGDRREFDCGVGRREDVGGAADPKRRVACERLVGSHASHDDVADRARELGRSHQWTAGTGAPARRSPRSSSAHL